jgi:hypothetical protein
MPGIARIAVRGDFFFRREISGDEGLLISYMIDAQ